ncbi:type III polyketide synthase [Falsibacillus pallidus]|uniref:15-methylpalmitoyl-4-hydroxy-2-pyrone synthase n=1 Tax=Falsibacillus pallidus TaxID=493781 RepID=A0A370GHB9_9BACI|nr:3-oxoacyl-[acyl-carrier-protein] synthase III C-terminal domain-containing protein [Falsibacillus pallidus]RDI43047.1 15-methylpalmitoyl-4-hydroxy-2-pyrone synthase [Falsibacillus pallidus]
MPKVVSVEVGLPAHVIDQKDAKSFIGSLFSKTNLNVNRLLNVFINGEIETRYFVKDLKWFAENHRFSEKNDFFIKEAVRLGAEAIQKCLSSEEFLAEAVPYDEIDAIYTICTTGLSTPSIEARIMNVLPFSPHTKRIPIWGLGCAGGAAGLSRAFEYCLAYPNAKVLVLSIELCSLTFQHNDHSKSNLVGTSLFADGVACALVCGDESSVSPKRKRPLPSIVKTRSTLMKDSLDVMGWDIEDDGLHVVFSKDIPSIVTNWLRPNVLEFLKENRMEMKDIFHFIAHPGGKKVLQAYQASLGFEDSMLDIPLNILKKYGNMSSATILYVLREFLLKEIAAGEVGLAAALGPGFSSELLLMRWE